MGYNPWDHKKSDTTEQLPLSLSTCTIFYSCSSNNWGQTVLCKVDKTLHKYFDHKYFIQNQCTIYHILVFSPVGENGKTRRASH